MPADRLESLIRFYDLLGRLEERLVGPHRLHDCHGRMEWPMRSVYFFLEPGEIRSHSGSAPRVVRVGTHALKAGSRTTLWNRLSQHRGVASSGGGNHRGSIFRLITGTSLMGRDSTLSCATWGQGSSAKREIREQEKWLERKVSDVIRAMPFLWLRIEDEPGPGSLRGYIERNAIALLSNYARPPLDPASGAWLGRHCDRQRVRESGLWNQNHVDERCDVAFLQVLEGLISES